MRRVAFVLALLPLWGCTGCGSDGSSTASPSGGAAGVGGVSGSAGTGGAGGGSAGMAGTSQSGAAGSGNAGGREVKGGDCPPVSFAPTPVIDDTWGQWSGFGCDVAVLFPPPPPKIPPLEWGPCPVELGQIPGCLMLGGDADLFLLSTNGKNWSQPVGSGSARFAGGRGIGKPSHSGMTVVIDESGTVLAAATKAFDSAKVYTAGPHWVSDDRWAINIYPSGPPKGLDIGVFGLRLGDQYPLITLRQPGVPDISGAAWAVTPKHVFRALQGITRYSWAEDGPTEVYAPAKDPDGLPVYFNDTVGDTLLLTVNLGGKAGVMSWTEEDGLRPLLRWYGSYEHFAVRFGTDGKDMVWVEGVGPQSSLYIAETMTLMTAPYSLDAKVVEATKKPLGTDPVQDGGGPFPMAVGCGHVATLTISPSGPTQYVALRVVRLSDGTRWTLNKTVGQYPLNGVGITCEHVYFRTPEGRLARFQVASLPPGGTPD